MTDIELQQMGNKIKQIRISYGMTMEEFISRIDGKPGKGRSGTVNNWESGKNSPNKKRLKAIAELGNIPVEYLVNGMRHNRLKQARLAANFTLSSFADTVGLSPEEIANFESSHQEPVLEDWNMFSNVLNVPVEYLLGLSNDPDGWDLWEKATGYSQSTIELQIQELIKSGKLSADDNIQKQIGKACEYLDGRGKTDYNAIMYARQGLYDLESKIHNEYYIDPAKKKRDGEKIGDLNLSTYKDYDGTLYYDDMNKEVYDKISEVFDKARSELADYLQNHQF